MLPGWQCKSVASSQAVINQRKQPPRELISTRDDAWPETGPTVQNDSTQRHTTHTPLTTVSYDNTTHALLLRLCFHANKNYQRVRLHFHFTFALVFALTNRAHARPFHAGPVARHQTDGCVSGRNVTVLPIKRVDEHEIVHADWFC